MSATNLLKRLDLCCGSNKKSTWIFHIIFLFFISYDHKYVHIKTFISDILQEATESELFRFGWKVHQILVEEKKYVYYSLFEHQVDIIFTAE